MRYQVQKYSKSDYNDRTVVASHEGLMSDPDLQAWFKKVVEDQEPSDGFDFAPVVETQQWFVDEDNPNVANSNADTSQPSTNKKPVQGEPVSFADIAKVELQRSLEERKEKQAAEIRLQAKLAELSKE